MLLRRKMSRRSRSTVKLVDSAPALWRSSVWTLRAPTSKDPTFPVTRPPPRIGTGSPLWRPMRRLKNSVGALTPPPPKPPLPRPRPPPPTPPVPKTKMPRPSQKELPLFGEEKAEPREVHLLFVHLDLGEVGVVREIGRQVVGDPDLEVQPRVGVEVIADLGIGGQVGLEARNAVRLDVDHSARRRCLQPDQRPEPRDPQHPPAACSGHRYGINVR